MYCFVVYNTYETEFKLCEGNITHIQVSIQKADSEGRNVEVRTCNKALREEMKYNGFRRVIQ